MSLIPALRAPLATALGALALCSALVPPAAAQTAKKDLAAKVVQLQMADIEMMARMIAGQAVQPMAQGAARGMSSVPAEKREALSKELQAELRKTVTEIEPVLVDKARKLAPSTLGPVLEEKFTEDELKQVIAWLESSASRKLRAAGQDLQGALAQKLVAETKGQVEPKLKALDDRMRTLFTAKN